ncbi:MAG: N-acetyl-D-myo-inositol-2-amino-2-deoxy-alpha-D-glucopyranoside deacetylase [Frankiaceae bacterium]|jgi:N-acetyl-1-D-myo-inositol-2-amino-2-deoxy-alpha-D-glucopyranoside deacetylase|nr:N-acetyl-D-myo-inositol-2-amino-2-deoxy-alpha-D-glucopyranoside deacetylase [Frankiaceae bacterium]
MSERSILFVHAHPDDECIPTGVTIARYAAEGARVTLVTCTRGEVGEIVVDDLKHLADDGEDALGEHRVGEMAEAAKALGIGDHRWLGGVGRYRDSGMMGTPENDDPRSFWRADLDEAVEAMARIIREVRPQVVVSSDENGDYGHPDHIQANRVAVAGIEAAADPARYPGAGEPWTVAKRYTNAMPKSLFRKNFDYFKESGDEFFAALESAEDLPFGVEDDVITTRVSAPEQLERKLTAMRAHRSQIDLNGVFFALPDALQAEVFGTEHFVLVNGTPGDERDAEGKETDLFAGVALGHVE